MASLHWKDSTVFLEKLSADTLCSEIIMNTLHTGNWRVMLA